MNQNLNQIPQIREMNGIPTLYVKGEPFMVLAGEIHNSSASSLEFMKEKVWPNLKDMYLNTVLVPLYWELIEPQEGEYQFDLVEGLIRQARQNQMHLIFLWFGLWKNAESMYVPGWMKKDPETYFRVRKVNGESINTISPLCEAAVEKDAAAFSKVMNYISKMDETESTVLMIQVENEIGTLGTGRDYSEKAQKAFNREIPEVLKKAYAKNGTWKEIFGTDAEEVFMAYNFSGAVEKITEAGRKEYPIPCYTNCWLKQFPWYPGSYPSGGPVNGMQPVWKLAAPSLFTLAPDIYVPYVADVMEEYSAAGNPLFIPEVRKDAVTSSYCFYAFGQYHAIGYSPFGIEELALPPESVDRPPMEVMMALNIDPSAFDITGSRDYLARTYELMEQIKPLYLKYRGSAKFHAFLKKSETDYGALFSTEKYEICVGYAPRQPSKPLAAGLIFELSADRFLLIGMQSTFTFRPKEGENRKVDLISLEEGMFHEGVWKTGRILNGDEKMSIRLGDMPTCIQAELFKY